MRNVVPAVASISGIQDPAVRTALQSLINGWQLRNGQIGDGTQRFLTEADIPDVLASTLIRAAGAINSGRSLSANGGGALPVSVAIGQLSDLILSSPIIANLRSEVTRIKSPAWLDMILGDSDYIAALASDLNASIANLNSALDAVESSVADLLDTPAYDNAETYAEGEMVTYDGGLYRALQSTTGNLPTNPAYWEKIGDYASLAEAVAAISVSISDHETRITNTEGDISAETTARETLASQLRGGYTGTDVASLSSGLVYSERQARVTADSALSTSISALSATVTSNNGTLTARIATEETARATTDTALSNSISTLSAEVDTNYSSLSASIDAEEAARATADEAQVSSIEVLNAEAEWQQQWNDIWNAGLGVNDAASTVYTSATVLTEQTARITADTAEAALRVVLEAKVDANDSTVRALIVNESTARATADSAEVTARLALAASVETDIASVESAIATESTARANADTAMASQITSLSTSVNTNAAAIVTEATTRADAVSAVASDITQLQTDVVGVEATAESALSLATTTQGVVSGAWSVKFNVDGYVTGAGLGLEGKGGSYSSTFGVLADNFVVAGPSVGGYVTGSPFIYRATPTTINGVSVPAGLYVQSAYIETVTADRIDSRGLTIKDAGGNVIFSSGVSLDWSRVGGAGRPANGATANPVVSQATQPSPRTEGMFWYNTSGSTINGVPPRAVAKWEGNTGTWVVFGNNVTESAQLSDSSGIQNGNIYISGGYLYGIGTGNGTAVANSNISISSSGVLIGAGGGSVTLGGLGAGLMALINEINSSNISTYIAGAAIGTAFIGDAAITNAKIENLTINKEKFANSIITTGSGSASFDSANDDGTSNYSLGVSTGGGRPPLVSASSPTSAAVITGITCSTGYFTVYARSYITPTINYAFL